MYVQNNHSLAEVISLIEDLVRRRVQFAVRHSDDGGYEITYHED